MGFLDDVKKYSNDITSKLNTPKPKKKEKAQAANPEENVAVVLSETQPNSGFADPPTVDGDASFPADYYRFGRLERDANGNTFFSVQPRFIDEWNANDQKDQLAAIKVITTKNGKEQELVPRFTKFFLQSVQEGHTERSQVVETFGDFYVFFYGERPPVYTFTGTLMNTKAANWYGDFQYYYENFLRGTRSVESQAVIQLTYQGRQIEGFILNSQSNTNAELQNGASISFQVLVTDRLLVNVSADFGLIENNGQFTDDKIRLDFLKELGEGLSIPNVSKAWNEAKAVTEAIEASASQDVPASTSANDIINEFKKDLTSGLGGKLEFPA
jgi:hypothetical protein